MLKNKINDIDFSLKQKYEAEQHRSLDLQAENDKWKNRYQAAEKSKLKEPVSYTHLTLPTINSV